MEFCFESFRHKQSLSRRYTKNPSHCSSSRCIIPQSLEETRAKNCKKKDLQCLLQRYCGLKRRFNDLLKSS
ncbi:hypothetical protein AC249_AIPGENE17603 [Exaiptasia diaphana]|nr:hypothetical protein AC249_AIPGENE17603 [Exaiptasia diaphana]